MVGESIGGKDTAVLNDVLLGGIDGIVRIDIDGLPVDVERTDKVSSTKFRAN